MPVNMNTRAREEEGEGEEQPLRAVDGVSWGVYRRSAIVMGAVFGVCLAVLHMAEHSGVRWLPLTVWWPPVTMCVLSVYIYASLVDRTTHIYYMCV